MNQEASSTGHTKRKRTLGEQVRKIADQLQRETDLQIKATSRILGAAAQISENHDRLIREVVDMVEEDLDSQPHVYQTNNFTVNILKQQFKTLGEAKSHFGLKANSWTTLANKLNSLSVQNLASTSCSETSVLKRLDAIEGQISSIRAEVGQILSLLRQLTSDKA
jgi:hypothetical protein